MPEDRAKIISNYNSPSFAEYAKFKNEITGRAAVNPETAWLVVPKFLLAAQGELLWKYINYPEKRPIPNAISPREIKSMLLDAAFKVKNNLGENLLYTAIEKRHHDALSGKIEDKTNSDIINTLIEKGSAKEILQRNNEGFNALDYAILKDINAAKAIITKDDVTSKHFLESKNGSNPFEIAIARKLEDIVAFMAAKMTDTELEPYKESIHNKFGQNAEDLLLQSVQEHLPRIFGKTKGQDR